MSAADNTTDPRLESWLAVAPGSDFPIQNLPFGIFKVAGGLPRIGVALGDKVLDVYAACESGLLDGCCDAELLQAPVLNPFLAAGRPAWRAVRERLSQLLRRDGDSALRDAGSRFFFDRRSVTMQLPVEVGDYVDFYSSIEHATNLG